MLHKRKGSKFWWIRLQVDGKLYQQSTRVASKSEARNIESAFRTRKIRELSGLVEAKPDARPVPSLEVYTAVFLNYLQPRVARRTWRFYHDAWRHILAYEPLAATRLDQVDARSVDAFVQHRLAQETTPVTINHSIRTLRRCLHIAEEFKIIVKAPKLRLLPGEQSRDYVLSEDTLSRFLALCRVRTADEHWQQTRKAMDLDMRPLLIVLYDTGIRAGEARGLQWSDVTFNNGRGSIHIRQGKSKNARRFIPLTERARGVLKELKASARPDVPFVFTRHQGQHPITVTWASHQFTWARRKLQLADGCVLHSTRHSFLTRLGEAGADAFTIQRLAGHATIMQSQKYVHPSEERMASTIALLDR